MAGKDEIGLNVTGLDKAGAKIKGRADGAKTSGKGVTDGIFSAGEGLGVTRLVSAAKTYVSDYLEPHSKSLGGMVLGAGIGVQNTSRTGRASDEEGGRKVAGTTESQLPLARPINGPNKVV